ncbi:related to MDN1 - Huge dynein-related AAA-type ATPase (midasin) [Melanopsichium pennsylvanicum]|uniref:Midasin n=2 Tax=Melanopsichium pennsylvanicum TaxID=63383 RepID=A0AAJ4XU59_9BASI|nr:related to MDN1-Huge dynein-related AAA-type ATPase (midasin) [Melanopsichium pennsylvanicum 4]SNX87533.1 related to MDN1 - Huge dynein-related AAA-type ATPase (midasin) [Melanopsichium pennsylvanicum]
MGLVSDPASVKAHGEASASATRPSALDIDVYTSCTALAEELLIHSDAVAVLQETITALESGVPVADALNRVASLLLEPSCTLSVAAHFKPLLLDLLVRSLRQAYNKDSAELDVLIKTLHSFAILISIFPQVHRPLSNFVRTRAFISLQHSISFAQPELLNQVLLDLYRIVAAAPHSLSDDVGPTFARWSHRVMHSSEASVSIPTRLLALNFFALQQGVSEKGRLDLQQKCLGLASAGTTDTYSVDALAPLTLEAAGVNLWTLELEEFSRIERARSSVLSRMVQFLPSSNQKHAALTLSDLSPEVCCIGGVLLACSPRNIAIEPSTAEDRFVETAGITLPLSELAFRLGLDYPILLSGPPSSGKSTLIRYLSQLLKGAEAPLMASHLLTIQLGDQSGIDAKQLLGSFVSSPTQPGKFEWTEGALTRAVRQGKWVVLEDIDKAGSEVLSIVARLVEQLGPTKALGSRAVVDLGSRGKVSAGDGFALFATRSIASSTHNARTQSSATFLGSSHWSEVFIHSPTQSDVSSILANKFPRLTGQQSHFANRLVATWHKLRRATQPSAASLHATTKGTGASAGSVRTATLRDLIKWCRRVERLLSAEHAMVSDPLSNPIQQEEIFIEACDIFLGSVPPAQEMQIVKQAPKAANGKTTDRYGALVELLAEELGLTSERAWWALKQRIPELSVRSTESIIDATALGQPVDAGSSMIRVGRCELLRRLKATTRRAAPVSRKFALTKPSLLLLERLSVCTVLAEPVLLVGETGTGKTTVIQHLASLLGQPMAALNLSQQTESGDLFGAFKPLDPKVPATELHDQWNSLFARTFSSRRNARFVDAERKAFVAGKWSRLAMLWRESAKMASQRKKGAAKNNGNAGADDSITNADNDVRLGSGSRKKRKTECGATEGSPANVDDARAEAELDREWIELDAKARDFGLQHGSKKKNLVFSFVEGPLVKALRQGDWILLDEINLAAAETLDSLTGLLQSPTSSITLTERGDLEPIPRHPNFRLFACMNPATDVGKKDLPASLRSRFTELYVPSPDSDRDALTAIVEKYIGEHALGDRSAIMDVAECYAEIRRLAQQHQLADGANQRPHYSIRTLSRALTFATDIAPLYGLRRSLWEGFIMAFTLLLDEASARTVRAIIERHTLAKAKNARAIATFVPPAPRGADEGKFVQVGPFWLPTGPAALDAAEDYILTASVQSKLVGLSRAALTRRFPVLIQGPTSAGKTSAVEYLARRTGHRFVRINNHEHTDIQEYIGSYASDPDSGKLRFQEGLLVKALRKGDWIVLDELNLAPTDVLEALNRLLDDNRELVIPETGETVKPHPHFMLFATQNPPGLYAGRKVLSRAFRNRFLELHFDDVPRAELETILTNRCKIAPSYSSRIVGVFEELQKRRQAGRVFETKQAFVTLRDLFRWGNREAVGYQQLAENGYMLIAERARRSDDKETVKDVIEKIMRVKLDIDHMYSLEGTGSEATLARMGKRLGNSIISALSNTSIVRTSAFQRLLCLVATSLRYNEPVLLVGETGAGKTSVCELLATAFGRELHCVNCHQNTDTADLLGGQRPLRNRAAQQSAAKAACIEALDALQIAHNLSAGSKLEDVLSFIEAILSKESERLASFDELQREQARDMLRNAVRSAYQATALFEWRDGPLVQAMRGGDHVLLDEISLADDSVLERLNSVLEPARTLVLAERATSSSHLSSEADISATQITGADGFQVLATMNPGGDYGKKELSPALRNRFTEIWVPHVDIRSDLIQIINAQWKDATLAAWTERILDFSDWFIHQIGGRDQSGLGLRDLLTWASFMNELSFTASLEPALAFAHGASLTIIDGLGALPATAAMTVAGLDQLRDRCLAKVAELIAPSEYDPEVSSFFEVDLSEEQLRIGPFSIPRGSLGLPSQAPGSFSFGARTSASNAMRVLRALSVPGKSVLLEGSPGAGKTSLITALASGAGRPLTRINLSDQTELVDLFGSDMPLEGGGPGEFAWRDAAFLTAMQQGEWVLLDEMNLASQTVLEGLNSCLDHRGTVYVPELGRSFTKHSNFRIFAAQNPHHQGGGRKGLPKSFLNRFIRVHIEELTGEDIFAISSHLYPNFDTERLRKMIRFNFDLYHEIVVKHSFGRIGAPWEFNLRDLMRWLDLLHTDLGFNNLGDPIEHLASLYIQRFRTASDRQAARELFRKCFGSRPASDSRILPTLTPNLVRIGHAVMPRQPALQAQRHRLVLLQSQLPVLEALMDCVNKKWLAILVGPTGSGKTSMVRLLAQLAGARLEEFQMNSGTDTMDLIGTFEQYDPQAHSRRVLSALLLEMHRCSESIAAASSAHLTAFLEAYQALNATVASSDGLIGTDSLVRTLQAFRAATTDLNDESLRAALDDAAAVAVESMQSPPDAHKATGRFEWTDGPLLRALQEGHWLMLDNANLCSASVLDRLNSLFEVNGSLVISERGLVDGKVPVVRPHPNFRVFMCLDPRHGELSRAMRNRGIELAFLPQHSNASSDLERLTQLCAADSGLPASPARSTQKELMDASLRIQLAQRGLEQLEVLGMDQSSTAQQRKAAVWAASRLALTNSTLASAVLPLYLAGAEGAASEAGASLLVRLSSPKALLLTWQVVVRCLSSVSEGTAALLREILSSTKNLQVSRNVFESNLVESGRISQELADNLAIDLRYDDNVLRLLESHDVPSQVLQVLLVAILRGLDAKQIMETASSKRMQDLNIMERSARLSGTAMMHDEDQATTAVRNVFPLVLAVNRMVGACMQNGNAAAFPVSAIRQVALLLRSAEYLQNLCASSELDYSSIQILVRFMSDLLRDISAAGIERDVHLIQTIDLLGGSLQLTSGKALFPIWSLFAADEGMQATLYRLICDEAALLPAAAGDLLKNALNVAATLCVAGKQSASPSELKAMMQLGWQTLKMIRSAGNKVATQAKEQITKSAGSDNSEAALLSIAEVSIKTPECLIDASQASRMRLITHLLESHSAPSVQAAAASCKATLWALDSGSAKSKVPLSDFTWIRRLWPVETGQASNADGPAYLLRPALLQALLESRFGNRSLMESALHDASVGRMIKTVGAVLPASSSSRAEKLAQIMVRFICLMSETLYNAALKDLAEHDLPSWKPVQGPEACCTALKRLQAAGQARLSEHATAALSEWVAVLDKELVPALSGSNQEVDATLLGRAWISVSLIMLRLYLPNVALDPIVARRTMADFGDFCNAQLDNAVELEVYAETIVTGESSNRVIRDLQAQIQETKLQLQTQGADRNQAWRKPNLKLLSQFYRETSSFLKEVVTAEKVADLVQDLLNGPSEQAEKREVSLQASLLSFGDRLRKTFAELRDMVEPIIASLLQLQLGLRLVRQANRTLSAPEDVKQRANILGALVTFPTAHSSALLRQTDVASQLQARSEVAASLLIVSAASLAYDHTSLSIDVLEITETLRNISRTYERIFQLWALDRERAKREEEENMSLYKSRKIEESVELDAEAEEKEFRSLFPEYDDDILEGQRSVAAANGHDHAHKGMLLPPPRFIAVLNAHMAIFGPASRKIAMELYHCERDTLAIKLMRKNHQDWPESIDQIGAAFGLSAAIDDQSTFTQTAKDFNFYLDPRPAEVRKATAIVVDLRTRLSALIQEWPEQMVLQHIRDRCDAVLRLDAASPVAKMLSALEQLLTHTEDWEGFASRETSIQANRERISAQIIEWRRLELSCWAELLNTQARNFQDDLGEWWFRVYEILIRGTRAASADGEEAFKEHVEQLIDAVDQFVRSSPLGQFEARLSLLESYGRFIDRLVRLAPPKESRGLEQIGVILQNITTFFRQFGERISSTLQSQRTVLEKDIMGFIKLASWKDINIHALKQSAQKTHRQLHKTLRKFRDVLRQPVDPMLASHLDALTRREIPTFSVDSLDHRNVLDVESKPTEAWTQAISFASLNESAPEHIRNLSKTLAVLQKMSGDRLWSTLLRPVAIASGVADLADEIVDRQQQLAKLTPAFSKEDNEKAIKNLTARKRKAWSDLLKELRRVGLSSFVQTDMAASNQSVMHIYTRPALKSACPESLLDEPFSTHERLFFRLLAALPKVRDSLQSHSPDLSTAELQRGINYVEHVTHLVLRERDRMHSELQTLSSLEVVTGRMRNLHTATLGTPTRASESAPFRTLADFLARLADALDEIKIQAPKFLATSAFSAGKDTLTGRLPSLTADLLKHALEIERIAKTAQADKLFFLTEEERASIEASRDLLDSLERDLCDHVQSLPALESLLHPVWKWTVGGTKLVDRCLATLDAPLKAACQPEDLVHQANIVVSAVLQVAQDIRRAGTAPVANQANSDEGAPGLADKVITTELATLQAQQAMLRSSSVLSEVQKLFTLAQQLARNEEAEEMVHVQLAAVYPFVHEFSELLRAHLLASAHFSRSLLKLDHTLCHLMTALASKGFCRPPEEQQDDDGEGDDGEQLEGGTGLGDGTGAKDVTDQMEDDEEIEELQKDNPADEGDEGEKIEREKNAKEADQDFGGDLEDVSVDGDEEAGSDQEGEDGDEEQPEDAVGEVDPLDPNAVDEKIWDGNEDDEDEKKDAPQDKTNKDLGADNADGKEADSVPKADDAASEDKQKQERPAEGSRDEQQQEQADNEQDQNDANKQEGGDDQDIAEPEEGNGDEEEGEGDAEEENEDADVQGEGGGRQIDQEVEQGENLDLDDDLNMEGADGKSDAEDDENGLDDFSDIEQTPEDQRENKADDKAMDDLDDDQANVSIKDQKESEETAEGESADDHPEDDVKVDKDEREDAMDEDDEDEGHEPQSQQERPGSDNDAGGKQDDVDPFDIDAVNTGADDGGQDEPATQQQSSRSQRGRRVDARKDPSQADQGMEMDDFADPAPQEQAEQPPSAGERGARAPKAEKDEVSGDTEQMGEEEADPNPLRRMGDALEQFRRRMQEIQAARQEEEETLGEKAEQDGEGMPQDTDLEHIVNDDDAELQALGAAQEQDEVKKLGDLGIEDIDESMGAKPRGEDANEQQEPEQQGPAPLPDQPEREDRNEKSDGQQKAFMPSDLKPTSLTAEQEALVDREVDANMADDVQVEEEAQDDEAMTPLPDDIREEVDDEVQQQLEAFRNVTSTEERLAKSGDLWRSYASLTADLAFSLCEQLRLILAPTLATRLNGDFRTGKRLNMRKIVPFIASDFAKDKIWLRRTKPSSREYQVMLAIDDSRSMSESRSAHLAYQTLALVTGALSRLEVGDVSVCRFGEDVDSLHDFGKGSFNDQNGAHVIDRLGFQQKKTNVLKLVEKSLDTLAEARAGRSSSSASQGGDLWQLEIIISDGICQDHAKLRSLLREAAEQRVMLVFVVIDSLQPAPASGAPTPAAVAGGARVAPQQPRSSILEMTNASYHTDANGRLQLRMERYMDTFPFDYYVVVREVEALPEVLSATLRQWVEKIRETES